MSNRMWSSAANPLFVASERCSSDVRAISRRTNVGEKKRERDKETEAWSVAFNRSVTARESLTVVTMNADECIIRDCSAMYRFQFASIAFLCILYLPYTFHANIWSLYTQSWTSVNCTDASTLIHAGFPLNVTNKFFSSNSNRSDCCPCYDFLHGTRKDHLLFTSCQTWFEKIYGLETRKGNIIDEVSEMRSIERSSSLLMLFRSGTYPVERTARRIFFWVLCRFSSLKSSGWSSLEFSPIDTEGN